MGFIRKMGAYLRFYDTRTVSFTTNVQNFEFFNNREMLLTFLFFNFIGFEFSTIIMTTHFIIEFWI